MTDDFPPTNDIAPTGNSYGHYDQHYAACQPTGGAVELVAIIGKHLKGRDVGCTSDELHCRAADALTAALARIAELERELADTSARKTKQYVNMDAVCDAALSPAPTPHQEVK